MPSLCRCDSYLAHDAGGGFFFDLDAPRRSLATDVQWMGWSPKVTTHTSDYFPVFYAMALELIDKGKAYVCHQSSSEIEACRSVAKARVALKAMQDPPPELVKEAKLDQPSAHESPYRNRSVEENHALFEKMRNGTTGEGECTLRLKMYEEGGSNFNMFDQVAYRARSRRPVVWRRLHAIDATRVHLTMTWVVYFGL